MVGGGGAAHFGEPTPPPPRSKSASLPSATEPATSHGRSRRHPAPLLGQNSMVVKSTDWRKQAPQIAYSLIPLLLSSKTTKTKEYFVVIYI